MKVNPIFSKQIGCRLYSFLCLLLMLNFGQFTPIHLFLCLWLQILGEINSLHVQQPLVTSRFNYSITFADFVCRLHYPIWNFLSLTRIFSPNIFFKFCVFSDSVTLGNILIFRSTSLAIIFYDLYVFINEQTTIISHLSDCNELKMCIQEVCRHNNSQPGNVTTTKTIFKDAPFFSPRSIKKMSLKMVSKT